MDASREKTTEGVPYLLATVSWEPGPFGNIGMLVFLEVHLQIYRQQSKLSKMKLTYGSLQGLKVYPPFASSWEETESKFLGSLGLVLSF